MSVSRLRDIPGIGVDKVGDAADAAAIRASCAWRISIPTFARPRSLSRPTRRRLDDDSANSYLPFQGLGHFGKRQRRT